MPSVVHVVTTDRFAGAERYVCELASETARRGWEVAVVGGHPQQMRQALDPGVRWERGAAPLAAARSLHRIGRSDICHAHMTMAEAVAVAARRTHRAPVVSTRHFAARRGSSLGGRLLAPWIAAGLAREIAMSDHVARHLERAPDATIDAGVRSSPLLWRSSTRAVLVLQRLEREKDTMTALRAWQASGLAADGWELVVAGDGAERPRLESWATSRQLANVTFAGWVADVPAQLARAGILLASSATESLGLSVLEAMAAGVPVVASAAGAHRETVGLLPDARLFPPGDAAAAAAALRSLLPDEVRSRASDDGRHLVRERFPLDRHVDRVLAEYEAVR